jgi:superfamily II DNA or RNA helicase
VAIKLRNYQKEAVKFLVDEIRVDKRLIYISAPTGAGSSIVLKEVLSKIGSGKLIISLPPLKAQYKEVFDIEDKYLATPRELIRDKLNLKSIDIIFLAGIDQLTKISCIKFIVKNKPSIKIVDYC